MTNILSYKTCTHSFCDPRFWTTGPDNTHLTAQYHHVVISTQSMWSFQLCCTLSLQEMDKTSLSCDKLLKNGPHNAVSLSLYQSTSRRPIMNRCVALKSQNHVTWWLALMEVQLPGWLCLRSFGTHCCSDFDRIDRYWDCRETSEDISLYYLFSARCVHKCTCTCLFRWSAATMLADNSYSHCITYTYTLLPVSTVNPGKNPNQKVLSAPIFGVPTEPHQQGYM